MISRIHANSEVEMTEELQFITLFVGGVSLGLMAMFSAAIIYSRKTTQNPLKPPIPRPMCKGYQPTGKSSGNNPPSGGSNVMRP
jgi:hypothetical protein